MIINLAGIKLTGLTPEALSIAGDWGRPQIHGEAPDPYGLTFTVLYTDGTTGRVIAAVASPEIWQGVGVQTATFSYTNNDVTVTAIKEAQVYKKLIGLQILGDWTNLQFINTTPNPAGLSFKAIYSDGSEQSVIAALDSPSTWSSAIGEQIATFSYVENGRKITAEKKAQVRGVPTSLEILGSWENPQFYDYLPDLEGLTFFVVYNNGSRKNVTSEVTTAGKWRGTDLQTASFSYTENNYTVSTTKQAIVVPRLSSLSGTINWNPQYPEQAPDLSNLITIASYNDSSSHRVDYQSYSPSVWSKTPGSQTITITYIENGVSASCSLDYTVVAPMVISNDAVLWEIGSGCSIYSDSSLTSPVDAHTEKIEAGSILYVVGGTSENIYIYNYGNGAKNAAYEASDPEGMSTPANLYIANSNGTLNTLFGGGYVWSSSPSGYYSVSGVGIVVIPEGKGFKISTNTPVSYSVVDSSETNHRVGWVKFRKDSSTIIYL